MASKQKRPRTTYADVKTIPFDSAQEAWFWFIRAQAARNDGARFAAGQGALPRPCEPIDILRVLDRLYRTRRLVRDHLLVLRHYGRRDMAPDPRRVKEARAYKIWAEALERIEAVLISKGIVNKEHWVPRENWQQDALALQGGMMQ